MKSTYPHLYEVASVIAHDIGALNRLVEDKDAYIDAGLNEVERSMTSSKLHFAEAQLAGMNEDAWYQALFDDEKAETAVLNAVFDALWRYFGENTGYD